MCSILYVRPGSMYPGFAVTGASEHTLAAKSVATGLFLLVAVAGFRKKLWFVVAALAKHGAFDFFHHLFFKNSSILVWWPALSASCGEIRAKCGIALQPRLLPKRRCGFRPTFSRVSSRMTSRLNVALASPGAIVWSAAFWWHRPSCLCYRSIFNQSRLGKKPAATAPGSCPAFRCNRKGEPAAPGPDSDTPR